MICLWTIENGWLINFGQLNISLIFKILSLEIAFYESSEIFYKIYRVIWLKILIR